MDTLLPHKSFCDLGEVENEVLGLRHWKLFA
jgi:hypothetical protein